MIVRLAKISPTSEKKKKWSEQKKRKQVTENYCALIQISKAK